MKMTVREYVESYIRETEDGGPEWSSDRWLAIKEGLRDFAGYTEMSDELASSGGHKK